VDLAQHHDLAEGGGQGLDRGIELFRRLLVRQQALGVSAALGWRVTTVARFRASTAASSSVKTSWRGRLAASQVKQVRRTMVSSQGLASGPRKPAKCLKAFINDSWTTSSESAALPVSHRARL
jgi:hypothetical protein